MSLELKALYLIHRNQIMLNAKEADGSYRYPEAYLYAVAHHIYPALHESWCPGEDPFEEVYQVSKDIFDQVTDYIGKFLEEDKPVPTYYELEGTLKTREQRYEVNRVLRYCYLDEHFTKDVFDALLRGEQHPAEAKSIRRPLNDDDLLLI